jgi:hypothetical protein
LKRSPNGQPIKLTAGERAMREGTGESLLFVATNNSRIWSVEMSSKLIDKAVYKLFTWYFSYHFQYLALLILKDFLSIAEARIDRVLSNNATLCCFAANLVFPLAM